MVDDWRLAGEEHDFTRWDETIFDRCLSTGFNPFGSGPTPIFLQHRDAEAPDADASRACHLTPKMRGADVEPPA